MEKEIALNLAQTQGAFLTSVRGIGLVLAAGVTAEIGDCNTVPFKAGRLSHSEKIRGRIVL